ncbi:MAG: hypothetical protein LBC67_03185 [Spirochaetales bacterium]|nr:hypothetical protein [Spirochaetales bacterium]
MSDIPVSNNLTLESVWAALKETDRIIKETFLQMARRQEEADLRLQETERLIKETALHTSLQTALAKEEAKRRQEEETQRRQEALKLLREEAQRRKEEAAQRKEEALQRKEEIRLRREEEAKLRQEEAQRRQEELKSLREEARLRKEYEVQRRKEEAQYRREKAEASKDAKRGQRELERQMKETDRKISKLGSRVGELIEHLAASNMLKQFKKLGYTFNHVSRNHELVEGEERRSLAEIDLLLENGEYALVVEVKSLFNYMDVKRHLKRLDILRGYADKRGDTRKFLAAAAGALIPPRARDYALECGLYVIEQTGDNVNIIAPPQITIW